VQADLADQNQHARFERQAHLADVHWSASPLIVVNSMRALTLDGNAVTLDARRPAPRPVPGEAIIRTTKATVGAVDLEIARGLLGFTGTLGQQFVGVVESVSGEEGRKLVGQRVVGPANTACGACDLCQRGLSAHCRQQTVLGMRGRDGCLGEQFSLPVRSLVTVPRGVDDDHAVFAQAVAAALQAARQITIEGKPYITILGDGAVGLLMAQVMSRLNASVRVIGRYSEKLALCERWGIKHRHVDDIGRRSDQDIVVDCTGSPEGLDLALQLVRPRGTIVLKTLLAPPSRAAPGADLSPLVRHEISLIGSGGGSVNEAMAMIARGDVDVVSLISRRMKLSDGPSILRTAAQPGVIRVLVDM
jgi:threonine dehydrogenase-like Zn-dependent dehydrogenase